MTSRYQKNCKYRDRVADMSNRDLYGETTSNMFALQADSGVHDRCMARRSIKTYARREESMRSKALSDWWFQRDQPLLM
jgi:hypothetical protein